MRKILLSKIKGIIKIYNTKITVSFQKETLVRSTKKDKEKPEIKLKNANNFMLQKNLKHLEFIDFLEAHYSEKDLNKLPLDFLQTFQNIKTQAQNNTINLLQSKVA